MCLWALGTFSLEDRELAGVIGRPWKVSGVGN